MKTHWVFCSGLVLLCALSFGLSLEKTHAAEMALPAGSLVLRGPSASTKAADDVASSTSSPEYVLGLKVEKSPATNGYSLISQAFDFNAFYQRFIPDLPVTQQVQAQLCAPRGNEAWRRQILKDAVADIAGLRVQFLGVRSCSGDSELLFRSIVNFLADPVYISYVTQRQPNGSIHIVDVRRFQSGELLSQTMRRAVLRELARQGVVTGPLNVRDQAMLSDLQGLAMFESRCDYGHFNLIAEAYSKLNSSMQYDRSVLFRYATCGEHSLNDILVPIDRWRKLYPDDPCPDLLLVNFYWRLYHGPRYVTDGPQKGVHLEESWTPQEEDDVTAAVVQANAWFADPVMETRLAHCLAPKQPVRAKALLEQAIKRVPAEPAAFSELQKLNLAAGSFGEVAQTLRAQETLCHTNLTAMVAASKGYTAFRKSFQWKKWQHEAHGVDVKTLMDTASR